MTAATIAYPILGEPIVVEFANTRYVDASGTFDFIGSVTLARGWFDAVGDATGFEPRDLTASTCAALVDLRDAVCCCFDARTAAASPPSTAMRSLEAAAGVAPRLRLIWDEGKTPRTQYLFERRTVAGIAGSLAHDAVQLLCDPDGPRVRVCDRPACRMRYLQQHRRRRYCNPRCANADRQARFQNKRGAP